MQPAEATVGVPFHYDHSDNGDDYDDIDNDDNDGGALSNHNPMSVPCNLDNQLEKFSDNQLSSNSR